MSIYSIYFSPTGGTRRVAGIIAQEFEAVVDIDIFSYETSRKEWVFNTEDVCIISVPSFGGRVPAVAVECLERMKGGGARAVLIAVYGNRAFEDTLLELSDCAERSGFKVAAAIAAVAQHSIIHDFGAGRPDQADEEVLHSFARQIRTTLEGNTSHAVLKLPGGHPYREYHGVPFKPTASEACTACGLCAEQCPVKAIPDEDLAAVEREQCISCMRCIAVCPQKARGLPEQMLSGTREKMKAFCMERKENQLFTQSGM